MAFMVKEGARLYYEDTGGSAPALLFLHGAGGNTVGNLTNAEIAAVRQRLAAAAPPRPPELWRAALGETFRRTQPVRAFLYAQINGLNAPLPADFRDQLGRLTTPVERYAAAGVPTMFLTSDEDGLIGPELSEKVHEHVPGSRFESVEGAGHSTYFERPDVFNREVAAFVKAHRP